MAQLINDKYITVKEYAKRQGISVAEAYSRLNNADLRQFVAIIGNVKMVSIDALPQEEGTPERTQDGTHAEKTADDKPKAEELKAENEALRLRVKALEEELTAKTAEIQDLSVKLADMAVNSQKITENALNVVSQAQILHAVDKQKKKGFFRRLLAGKKEEE